MPRTKITKTRAKSKRIAAALIVGVFLAPGAALADAAENPLAPSPTWEDLKGDVVGDAAVLDGAALFDLDAPYRAHDAATVPIKITQTPGTPRIAKLTLVVDENPAPVVAEFAFGPSMGALALETRVRVDQYSNIRAIAETEDGKLWMTGRFVKGAGGCSAPALKDMEAALAAAGRMRMKLFTPRDAGGSEDNGAAPRMTLADASEPGRREAQVMVRHPNYSGMQRNQVTQLFIPAYFIHELDVYLGEERLIHMDGGISISEDPSFRFRYTDNGAETFRVRAADTDGGVFEHAFPANGAG